MGSSTSVELSKLAAGGRIEIEMGTLPSVCDDPRVDRSSRKTGLRSALIRQARPSHALLPEEWCTENSSNVEIIDLRAPSTYSSHQALLWLSIPRAHRPGDSVDALDARRHSLFGRQLSGDFDAERVEINPTVTRSGCQLPRP